jgi:hypothetical protein
MVEGASGLVAVEDVPPDAVEALAPALTSKLWLFAGDVDGADAFFPAMVCCRAEIRSSAFEAAAPARKNIDTHSTRKIAHFALVMSKSRAACRHAISA